MNRWAASLYVHPHGRMFGQTAALYIHAFGMTPDPSVTSPINPPYPHQSTRTPPHLHTPPSPTNQFLPHQQGELPQGLDGDRGLGHLPAGGARGRREKDRAGVWVWDVCRWWRRRRKGARVCMMCSFMGGGARSRRGERMHHHPHTYTSLLTRTPGHGRDLQLLGGRVDAGQLPHARHPRHHLPHRGQGVRHRGAFRQSGSQSLVACVLALRMKQGGQCRIGPLVGLRISVPHGADR